MNERANEAVSEVSDVSGNTESVENSTPDYASEIAKRKLAIKKIERESLDKNDDEVNQLEAEIYDLERQQAAGPIQEKISEHKQRLAEIEAAVRGGRVLKGNAGNMAEVEAEVEAREIELRKLTKIVNAKSIDETPVAAMDGSENKELVQTGPVEEIGKSESEDAAEMIGSTQDFPELYTILEKLQSITGSNNQIYTAWYLKNEIEMVRKGERTLGYITRSYGLRDKVEKLLLEESTSLIQSTTNFTELYSVLDRLQGVTGSDGQEYPIDYVKKKIDQVRSGERTTDYITRSLGLRSKVEELLAAEHEQIDGEDESAAEKEIGELEGQIKPPTDAGGVPENLPVGSVEEGSESGGGEPEVEQPEAAETESLSPEAIAEREIMREHLRLKREMIAARTAFYDALDSQYKDPAVLKSSFGIGRDKLSGAAREANNYFGEKNEAFNNYHEGYAVVEKRRQRLAAVRAARAGETVADFNLDLAKLERHLYRPEDVRLEKQKHHLPESIRSKLDLLSKKIKENPKTAMALGGAVVAGLMVTGLAAPLTMAAGMSAGLGTRWAGNKWYVGGKQAKLDEFKAGAVDRLNQLGAGGLRQMAEELHQAERMVQKARVRTKVGAVAAGAVAAGTAGGITSGFSGAESVPVGGEESFHTTAIDEAVRLYAENKGAFSAGAEPEIQLNGGIEVTPESTPAPSTTPEPVPETVVEEPSESVPETETDSPSGEADDSSSESSDEEVPPVGSSIEALHTVERGEVLSKIVLESLRERVLAGEIQLPEGVDQENLSHYMYQSFPEMTSASNIEPRLSVAEWQELGVKSGDPHLIRPGEEIDVQGLLEKLWGTQPETPTVSEAVTPPVEAGAEPIETPVEASGDSAPAVEEVMDGQSSEVTPEVGGAENIPSADGSGGSVVAESGTESSVASPETGDVDADTEAPPVSGEEMPSASSESPEAWLYDEPRIVHSLPEVTAGGYEPYVSERLSEMVTIWPEQGVVSLHEYLYQIMLQGFHTGHIELPIETAESMLENEAALRGFIEKHLPGVNEYTYSTSFLGKTADSITTEQWQAFGIDSGNPKIIAPGEQIKTGEIISVMLERAARAVTKT